MGIDRVLSSVSDIKVVGTVGTTTELFQILEKVTPHVIILEMDIPELNGIAT